jgi:hypothetical protein
VWFLNNNMEMIKGEAFEAAVAVDGNRHSLLCK